MRRLTGKIDLIPHIDIDPNAFRTDDYRSQWNIPDEEKTAFWDESLKNAPFPYIKTFYPYMWSVDVRDASTETLFSYLFQELSNPSEIIRRDDLLLYVAGGFTLLHANQIIVPPQCCTDLTNIEDWETAVAYRGSDWIRLWNGHPWQYISYKNGDLLISDATEKVPTHADEILYAVPKNLLTEAVIEARKAVDHFAKRFVDYWNEHTSFNTIEI